jgi:integrase
MSLPAQKIERPSTSPLFLQAVDDWFRKKSSSGRWSEGVQDNVARFVRAWKESFGAKAVGDLQILEVEAHEARRASRKKGGISASIMNQERAYLRQFLRWAKTHGWIDGDPTAAWEPREEVVQKKYVPLTLQEEQRLVRCCPRWLSRAIRFAIATGLRQGTIRKLLWSMVGARVVGGKRIPVIDIPARIMKTRKNHWIPLADEALDAMGRAGKPDSPIFFLKSKSAVCYWFKKAVKAAGIDPACSFHDTRRTFVARLAGEGTPMNLIMRLGAWRRPTTMLIHYTELQEEVALDALQKIHRKKP